MLAACCLLLALVGLAACGGGSGSEPGGGSGSGGGPAAGGAAAGDAGSDRPAEGGGQAGLEDARIGDDGQTVEFEGTTGDGQQFAGTAGMSVPEDFPLPIYPEWTVMAGARADVDGGVQWNAAFQFDGEPADLLDQYARELEGLGLAIEKVEIGSDLFGITFEGTLAGRFLEGEVGIGSPVGMKIINIQVRAPQGG